MSDWRRAGTASARPVDAHASVNVALLVVLALVPVYAAFAGNPFVLTLFTRILIMAIAALSLNLIMGYGGMVSFGHAAYLGIGGYAVGILAQGRHRLRLRAMAGRGRGIGAVRAGDRRAMPAHARRLFHHDHARLRADGLLRRAAGSTVTAATTA